MKIIEIKAGERKRIIFQFFNSLPQEHNFSAEPLSESDDLDGTIEIKRSNGLTKKVETQELKRENKVIKTVMDNYYSVYVTPKQDTKITRTSSPIKYLLIFLAIAFGITTLAITILFSFGLMG